MENEGTETEVIAEGEAPKADKPKRVRAKKAKGEPQMDTPSEREKHTAKSADPNESKQDKLLRLAEEKSAEDLKNRKEGRVSKSSETKRSKPKSKKAASKPKAEKAKKPKAAAKKGEKKPKKAAKPSDKGLTKAGAPRLKAEFDPDTTKGQRGERLKLEKDELNENEATALTAIRKAKGPIALSDLAERAFSKNLGKAKCNSRARNALRRLIRAGFVKKTGRGEYEAKIQKAA